MIEQGIFWILTLFLVGGSLGMITSRHSVFASANFMLAMIALSGIFALLNQSFLFLAQILVAVGAVITLALLVIVSVNIHQRYTPDEPNMRRWLAGVSLLVLPFFVLLINTAGKMPISFKDVPAEFGTVRGVGATLFSDWVLPFELVSILLLVAMLAAIIISRRGGDHDA
jgi:NADH-quinone oxidoreductase subunit J